ncbi:DUF5753 domain-containing protein [Bailinhaonella thermotolerans]|uniref:DUF5753 domain-containing protein n=1 Tax=Bailinhaonella thermotolerans TaxID=1070861 RepID=A0A3A4APU6_9ACTN|nr:DUF5753 domain-containing protein [Bailinhaonella thermotolerans]RJL21430.1 hypothetical protein D5H75_37315 [Bailinhaonella thermotolerans]
MRLDVRARTACAPSDDFVAVRMARQSALTREEPARLHAILGEGVLHQPLGGPSVFRAQLEHLRRLARRDGITIQVLPFSDRPHAGMHGAFTILRLASLDVVSVEMLDSDAYIEDEASVTQYLEAFDQLIDLAMTPAESIDMIAKVAR